MKILTNPLTISGNVLDIIKNSNEFLYLASPFIKLKDFESTELALIKRAIMVAVQNKVDIRFITRPKKTSDTSNNDPLVKLKPFLDEGCKLNIIDNLHSKVYCNESKALITSMNMYLHSIMNNEEIGVLLTKEKEEKQYNQVRDYLNGLTENIESNKVNNVILSQNEKGIEQKDELYGDCIRCGKNLPFNKEKPLCWNCFDDLRDFQGDIWGSHCHLCGQNSNVTDLRPLCYSCYQKNQNK